MSYRPNFKAFQEFTDNAESWFENDFHFICYGGEIRVYYDREEKYADVYFKGELLHDGVDLVQANRYLKTQK